MSVRIDFAQARELLGQVILERGDAYAYEPTCADYCTYWNTNTKAPDCGVGCVLSKAGVPDSVIEQLDGNSVASFSTLHAQGVLIRLGISVTPEAMNYLQAFQGQQDSGVTWGEAQEAAEKYAIAVGLVDAETGLVIAR